MPLAALRKPHVARVARAALAFQSLIDAVAPIRALARRSAGAVGAAPGSAGGERMISLALPLTSSGDAPGEGEGGGEGGGEGEGGEGFADPLVRGLARAGAGCFALVARDHAA
jgi:hypothetical protein